MFSPADEAFRREVREFLAREMTPELKASTRRTTTVFADKDVAMHWQAILVKKGWAVPSWPVEHGGTNWTVTQKYI
ncbi:MAG TPA: acyl-CoA dehydrogenase family protein, partial [Pseudomonadales bacterium]